MLNFTHLLIAGTPGSGKSVLLRHLLNARPKDAELVLIDPKRVDLYTFRKAATIYADNAVDAVKAFRRVAELMESRYKYMRRHHLDKLTTAPVWVVVDELADLMLSPLSKAIRRELQHLLQLGRACNIHVLTATQCPNRRVIPAELVLCYTERVALRCLSPIESRQIINTAGAETLPKYGEGLLLDADGLHKIVIPPPNW